MKKLNPAFASAFIFIHIRIHVSAIDILCMTFFHLRLVIEPLLNLPPYAVRQPLTLILVDVPMSRAKEQWTTKKRMLLLLLGCK